MIDPTIFSEIDFNYDLSQSKRSDRVQGFLSRHGYLKYVDGQLPDVPRIHINDKSHFGISLNVKEMNKSINRLYRLNVLNVGINRSKKGIYLNGDQDTLICLDTILHWVGEKRNPKIQEINKLKVVIVVHCNNGDEIIYLKY